MTQAERFVRNLCEDAKRRVEMEKGEEVSGVPEKVALADVPVVVRHAISTLKRLRPQVEKAEKAIKAHGYQITRDMCSCDDGEDVSPREVVIDYSWRNKQQSTIRSKHERRQTVVARLQNAANVAILGRAGADAKAILDKLQKDLSGI